jgi:hypothetical protein
MPIQYPSIAAVVNTEGDISSNHRAVAHARMAEALLEGAGRSAPAQAQLFIDAATAHGTLAQFWLTAPPGSQDPKWPAGG